MYITKAYVRPVSRLVIAACAIAALAACQTQQQRITEHEDKLSAAGFTIKPANTPERQTMLHKLPPNKFVQRTNGDDVHYVYADPVVCNCLYVGSQQAFNEYKKNEQQQKLADQQEMTAQLYSDPAWNWGAWGPWGPGLGFRYGPGRGW
ncbi:MAG: uncharacterized protein JWN58_829 [Gammaproteobacteria bacterium]|jgi:hypothetical protein|nr:uncharacterized protein [Gammaproteobacteria bacterium]